MDRRKFFKVAAGTVAAAGIGNILRAQSTTELLITLYYTDTATNTSYSITFYTSPIKSFGTADREKKVITLQISKTDMQGNKTTSKYESELVSSELMENSTSFYQVKGRALKLIEGADVLPANYPKRISFKIYLSDTPSYEYVIIEGDEGTEYMKLLPPVAYDYDDEYYGCFLTTACVENKGLPDDCYELQTLRSFRDRYMRNSPDGAELVDDYYKMGPAVVRKINALECRTEVYDHIYGTLILPCLEMIEKEKFASSMRYYRDYVVELDRQLA